MEEEVRVLERGKSLNLRHVLIQYKLLDLKVFRFMESMCRNRNTVYF